MGLFNYCQSPTLSWLCIVAEFLSFILINDLLIVYFLDIFYYSLNDET